MRSCLVLYSCCSYVLTNQSQKVPQNSTLIQKSMPSLTYFMRLCTCKEVPKNWVPITKQSKALIPSCPFYHIFEREIQTSISKLFWKCIGSNRKGVSNKRGMSSNWNSRVRNWYVWYPRRKMELKGLISYVTTAAIKNRHLSNAFSTLQKVSQELLHNRICSYASSLLVASAPLLQCRCSFPQITWPSTMVAELSVINNALGTVLTSGTTNIINLNVLRQKIWHNVIWQGTRLNVQSTHW